MSRVLTGDFAGFFGEIIFCGRKPRAEAPFFHGRLFAGLKPCAPSEGQGKGKSKYGDSGCARMTTRGDAPARGDAPE